MSYETDGINRNNNNSKQNGVSVNSEHPYVIDLINRTKSGDEDAFAEILHLYSSRILYLIKRYSSDPTDIADISQEVYIRLFKYMQSFKGDSTFYTWLYSVISSVAKNYLINKSKHNYINANDDYNFTDYMDFAVDVHENVDPQEILVSDETLDLLANTINNLPKLLKEAILLREVEGLTYEDIAESLDTTVGTIRSRIFRARTIIEDSMNGDDSILMLHHKINKIRPRF